MKKLRFITDFLFILASTIYFGYFHNHERLLRLLERLPVIRRNKMIRFLRCERSCVGRNGIFQRFMPQQGLFIWFGVQ